MYLYKCFQEEKLLVAVSTFLSVTYYALALSYYTITCIMTLPLWKTIIVGISLQAQKCTYMIICTVPNISLHTITVLLLTTVYFTSEVHCTLNVLHSITPHTIHTLL